MVADEGQEPRGDVGDPRGPKGHRGQLVLLLQQTETEDAESVLQSERFRIQVLKKFSHRIPIFAKILLLYPMEWFIIIDEDKDHGDDDHTPGQGDPEVHSEVFEVGVKLC